MRVACIGECMVELREQRDGTLHRGYGGDTLNTAVYLARLGVPVSYVTALGDDPWSDEMVAGWQGEGVDTATVIRLPGRLPGLYLIQTDSAGERRFSYWRDSAAARLLFDHIDRAALETFDVLYVSGITFSIYADHARSVLFDILTTVKARGGTVVFDTNFRPRGWPDRAVAQGIYDRMFALSDIILASSEDLELLFGEEGETRLLAHASGREIVLKRDTLASHVLAFGSRTEFVPEPVAKVVDTTAAGDSFAAAYIAARLRNQTPAAAARAGHRLAGIVVGYSGAIIPKSAMPASA